jgi:acyl-CoA synthetase (NDP forming)
VGASREPDRIGGRILARLLEHYAGEIFPVNNKFASVQGRRAWTSVSELPEPVDLAVISTPGPAALPVIRECAERGVRSAAVLAAGFAETGVDGRRAQDEMARIAAESGMRIMGPNCLGVVNLGMGLSATFASALMADGLRTGKVALISQSGGFAVGIFGRLQDTGLGASYLLPTGNEADVTCGELVGYVAELPDVDVIVLLLESIRKPAVLLASARRALELGKPVVAMSMGASAVGGRAALSHTGAMSSSDDVVSAAFDSVGIIRAHTPREVVELTRVLSAGRRPRGRRLALATGSGGMGVFQSDVAESCGLQMPAPSAGLAARLREQMPSFGSAGNPIDPTAHIVNDMSRLSALMHTLVASPEYDMVCYSGVTRQLGEGIRATLHEVSESTDKPFVVWSGQDDVALDLQRRGVTGSVDPDLFVRALAMHCDHLALRDALLREPPRDTALVPHGADRVALSEAESRGYVTKAGIAVPQGLPVADVDAAVAVAAAFSGPVVMKLDADWLTHKTDVEGVRLSLDADDEVATAFRELELVAAALRPDGADRARVVVMEMVPKGIELLCALGYDTTFGPVLTVGLGGVMVEIVRERVILLAPATHAAARRAVGRLAGGRLVGHRRGLDEQQADAVADVLVRLGTLPTKAPEVVELELNPVIVTGDCAIAVDAMASVTKGGLR